MNQNLPLRCASFLLMAASAVVVLAAARPPVAPWIFMAGAAGIFVSMLLLTRLCRDQKSLLAALLLALLVRALFVAWYPPAVDVNRYIWEGTIQHLGANPFTATPNDIGQAGLPGSIWNTVYFRDIATIYWPFAQLLFLAATAFGPSFLAMKLMVTLFDVAAIGILLLMAARRNHPRRYVLLYALNPLVLISISGQGHIESLVATLILAAVALAEGIGKNGSFRPLAYSLAYCAIACAILTKIYAIVLLPFCLRTIGPRRLVFLLLPLLLFTPYLTDISAYFATPLGFAGNYAHNGLLHTLLRAAGLTQQAALLVLAGFLGAALALVFFLTPSLLKAASLALGLMLVSLPTVHPWYFLLVAPYLVFFRQGSWLSLQLTALPMIFYFNPAIAPPFFHDRNLLMAVEYLPFLLLAASDLIRTRERWPAAYSPPGAISVIVPVRNEEERMSGCIASVRSQGLPCEIVVVDGGSSDGTVELVAGHPDVILCRAAPGRGTQIAEGLARAKGDVAVVLHADSRLKPGALAAVLAALRSHPDAAGGAMAATYDNPSPRFTLIALLNNFRARFTGISFGDQAQFFRRAALPEGFPEYRLMEDVELAMRLKDRGSLLFLPDGVASSSRRWATTGYFANFAMVIRLTGTFLVLRAFGRVRDKGEWFYQRYYRRQG